MRDHFRSEPDFEPVPRKKTGSIRQKIQDSTIIAARDFDDVVVCYAEPVPEDERRRFCSMPEHATEEGKRTMDRQIGNREIGNVSAHHHHAGEVPPAAHRRRRKNGEARRSAARQSVGAKASNKRSDRSFEDFAAAVHRELAPEGILERVLADLAARSAWELDQAVRPGRCRDRVGPDRLLLRALDALEQLRDRRGPRWGRAVTVPFPDPGAVSLNDPDRQARCVPYHVEGLGTEDADADALPDVPTSEPPRPDDGQWRTRLMFDPDVSDLSPVVRGTWITASHLVTLIVDGWSWADILRAHPELTEEDIRACVCYTIEQEEALFALTAGEACQSEE